MSTPNHVQILWVLLCWAPPKYFLFIYSHFSKYLNWLKIILFQRLTNKSILRLTTLYCYGLCFKWLLLHAMISYLMLRGKSGTTYDHQDYFRYYTGDQNREHLFLNWDVTKNIISSPDWCFISYFSYFYGTMLTVFIRKWPAGWGPIHCITAFSLSCIRITN